MFRKILLSSLRSISKAFETVLITAILSRYVSPETFINFHKIQNLIQIFVGFGGGFINSTITISLAPLESNGNKSHSRLRAFNAIAAIFLFFSLFIYLIIWFFGGVNFFGGSKAQALILFPLTIAVLVFTSTKIAFLISQNRQNITVIASIVASFISISFCLITAVIELSSLLNFFLLIQGFSFLLIITAVDILKFRRMLFTGFLFKVDYLIILITKNRSLIVHSVLWAILYPSFFLTIRYLIERISGINAAVEWEIYTRLGQSIFLINSTIYGLFFVPEFLKISGTLARKSLIFSYFKLALVLNGVMILFLVISLDWIFNEIFMHYRSMPFFIGVLYVSAEAIHGICWVFLITLVVEKRVSAFWKFEGLFRVFTVVGSIFAVSLYGSSAYYLLFFASSLFLMAAIILNFYRRGELVS